MTSLVRLRRIVLSIAGRLVWLPPALARLVAGVIFMSSGWGKLHNLDKVTQFFTQLHIPAPAFNAAFVGTVELVCGFLLLIGLLTRLAAIPLIVTMIMAIATAKADELEGFRDFLKLEEVHYIVLFVWLAIAGAGALSLDYLASRRLAGGEGPREAGLRGPAANRGS